MMPDEGDHIISNHCNKDSEQLSEYWAGARYHMAYTTCNDMQYDSPNSSLAYQSESDSC